MLAESVPALRAPEIRTDSIWLCIINHTATLPQTAPDNTEPNPRRSGDQCVRSAYVRPTAMPQHAIVRVSSRVTAYTKLDTILPPLVGQTQKLPAYHNSAAFRAPRVLPHPPADLGVVYSIRQDAQRSTVEVDNDS